MTYHCEKCNKDFFNPGGFKIHIKFCGTFKNKCEKCGEGTNNAKFCSKKCSASVIMKGRKHSLETRIKISSSLGGNGDIRKIPFKCPNCNKDLKSTNTYCNQKCQYDYLYKESVKKWLSGKESGTTNSGMYKGFIKRWLIETYGNKCCKCGWNEIHPILKKVPIELDHIDGNGSNNRPENVRLLCPNCHTLTPNYRFLNAGNGNPKNKESMMKHLNKKKEIK